MPLNDDDFEVIEETINDFDYFYDEDEEQKRNKKIIIKYPVARRRDSETFGQMIPGGLV